jgi:hypothetical protein
MLLVKANAVRIRRGQVLGMCPTRARLTEIIDEVG